MSNAAPSRNSYWSDIVFSGDDHRRAYVASRVHSHVGDNADVARRRGGRAGGISYSTIMAKTKITTPLF